MNVLQGKKTYSVVIAGILAAAAGWLTGELSLAQAIEAVLIALGIAGIRHGVTTEAQKPKKVSAS